MKAKVSDLIADFFEEKKIRHVFGIIGAGNAHIFDSIYKKGFTEIVCVHHEQAATMAMQTYYRTSGQVTASILTTGGGATNGITGLVSAWADSIPGIVIAGNENSKYMDPSQPHLRMWGVQGFDSSEMVKKVTKYANQILDPENVISELKKAFEIAVDGRPGPCWLDIPMNIQSSLIDNACNQHEEIKTVSRKKPISKDTMDSVVKEIQNSERPLFWLGNGIRLSGGADLVEPLLNHSSIPTLLSWAGIDLVDSDHPMVFGRAGVYGQRAANFILQNCDLLICIGTRMAIPQVGYDISELAREARVIVVDIDEEELKKYPQKIDISICSDAKDFLQNLISKLSEESLTKKSAWIERCNDYKLNFPIVNKTDHPEVDGFINSYYFMDKLSSHLKDNQIIVTDMGTALLSGHQVLSIKDGQRLMTSTGLGEMGYGLPGAIGASFATNKGEVLCLNCDGGMMMNLQELQTIDHHKLPIKIIIFNNDGYLMIKHTQKSLFDGRYACTDKNSGISCPNFAKVAAAFNMPSFVIKSWEDFETVMPAFQSLEGPAICEVFMHPEQNFVPKLSFSQQKDGTLISPPLEDLSPLLSRAEFRENMLIGIHKKSDMIED